jgi:sirohydrochlorin cobaltochelatase
MKPGILLAAFGAGSRQGENALHMFDAEVRARFPGFPVRWAFTSPLLRERLARGERKKTDSVRKALEKMCFERYSHVAVQPLHCIPGTEYADVLESARSLEKECGVVTRVGAPLLHSGKDIEAAATALLRHVPAERARDEAVLWMGHGARHAAALRYEALACAVRTRDPLAHVGTLGNARALPRILENLLSAGARKVWLLPLLSVVGGHVLRDMAGPEPESWQSRIRRRGLPCTTVLKGSAEYPGIIRIWLEHLETALQRLACRG